MASTGLPFLSRTPGAVLNYPGQLRRLTLLAAADALIIGTSAGAGALRPSCPSVISGHVVGSGGLTSEMLFIAPAAIGTHSAPVQASHCCPSQCRYGSSPVSPAGVAAALVGA